jgi:hypothetical protein
MASDSTTFAAHLHPAWMRWVIPSVGDLFFVALFCLLAFTNLSSRLLGDAGIGWHIRTGQLILSTHAIPLADPFSSSMAGHRWFAWEWLYDLFVGRLESATGLNGVVVFSALIIVLTFSLAFRWLVHRGANVLVTLLLVLLATSASIIHFLARPHVLSWLFALLWFWILESSERNWVTGHSISSEFIKNKNDHHMLLWLLPLTMMLWVNVHGGFPTGLLLLAIYWTGAAWQWLKPAKDRSHEDRFDDGLVKIRARRRVRDLTLAIILTSAATVLNPYGFDLHLHIYHYLSNRFLMDHIDEFQSPNFHFVAQKCFAGLILLTLLALAGARRQFTKLSVSHGLLILFAVYSGLYSSRNIPVSSLLLIVVIAPLLSDAMTRLSLSQRIAAPKRVNERSEFLRRMHAVESNLRGHLWPITTIMLACWIAAHGGKFRGVTLVDAHFDNKRFPAAAVNYIEQQDLNGPIFAPDYWGGYLIYRLYPQTKVVLDDRHDLYGESFFRSYLRTTHVEPGWEDFLDQHPAQSLIVPKGSALANILAETESWKSIYHDDVAVVFVKTPTNGK